MSGHFQALGIPIPDEETFAALMDLTAKKRQVIETSEGYNICWALGEEVELWARATRDRQLCGLVPHASGKSEILMCVDQTICDATGTNLDGGFHGQVMEGPEESANPLYQVFVDVPDFAYAKQLHEWPSTVPMQIAGFAHELRCFADTDEFARDPQYRGLSPQSVIPKPTVDGENGVKQHIAEAMIAGLITRHEVRTNPVTKVEFTSMTLESYGGSFDVVSDRSIIQGSPKVGGTACGRFWLSGRVKTTPSE